MLFEAAAEADDAQSKINVDAVCPVGFIPAPIARIERSVKKIS